MMNPEPFDADPAWDEQLAAVFAGASAPAPPASLSFRVHTRLRRQRLIRRSTAGLAAAALLAVAVLAWQLRPAPPGPPDSARGPGTGPAPELDVPEPAFLASAPPVDKLDALARQQAAFLTVLDQLEKEF